MKLTLHHINVTTENVDRLDRFYREVLGLARETGGLPVLDKTKGYAGDVAFVTDGAIQTHLAQKDTLAGFGTGQIVNPVSHGHIAYRTDDLAAFKAHLDAKNIPYSDWGNTAVEGWHQVFFYDPEGNVIEVHQVDTAPDQPQDDLLEQLVTCERRVWAALMAGDQAGDAAQLADDFLGAYPDGFADKAAHVGQLGNGPTVASYQLSDLRCMALGEGHALLCYQATYTRVSAGEAETMLVSSIWKQGPNGWTNIFSQDTPRIS